MITFLDKKWFEGLYWWSWRTNPSFGGVHNRGFTPQNKPAEALIKQWYELPRKDYNTLVPQLSEEGVADRMTYLFGGKTGEPAEIGKTGETGAPVSGGIFFNASDPGKTTHLYVSNIDAYKIVAGKILNKLIPGDIITLAAFDGSSTRAVYQVVDVADSGEMFNITVIPVYSNGIFEKNARLGFTSAGARTMSLGYISYLFEKNTRQVPGERFIALDNDNPSAVSCVYVSNTDKGGFERDRVLREITPGDMLYLFATDGTGAQAVYQVTSVVAADDHYNINVMPVSSEGDFNDNASVGLCYTRYNDISVLYFFSEDTTSVAPESGHVEMDVSVPREVTHIYIYDIDAKGKIMERALDGIKAGDFLTFSGEDGSVARMTYIVTAVSDAGPYHDFTVNYVSSEGFFEGGEKMRMTTAGIDLLPALYLFSKETDSMPGPGQVILNNTDPVTATHIFAYASDTNGIIRDRIFKKIIKGDIIKLKALDSDAIAVYQVVKIRSNRDIHDITVIPVCSRGVFKDKLRLELTATAADFTPLMYLFSEKIEGISPEEGSLSLDNVDPVSASALYVNKKDNDGNMNGSLFNSVSPEDLITLISAEGGDGRVTYRVKSVSDGGESYSIMVIPVSAENTFRTGERIAFVHTTQDACRTPGPKK
jgi:hypothetical protein